MAPSGTRSRATCKPDDLALKGLAAVEAPRPAYFPPPCPAKSASTS